MTARSLLGDQPWAALLGVSLVIAALVTPGAAEGQVFEGRVVEEGSEEPVPTALVHLIDAEGEARALAIADSSGRYRLEAPEPGVYRLEASRLGYRDLETPQFDVSAPDGVYPVDLVMRAAPVELPGLTVETNRLAGEELDRSLRLLLGSSPRALRFRPIDFAEIQSHIDRGHNLEDLLRWTNTASLIVRFTTEGPCFSLRGRGCLPVYLNGLRLNEDFMGDVPLDMLFTILVVTPTDPVMSGAGVYLYTETWLR